MRRLLSKLKRLFPQPPKSAPKVNDLNLNSRIKFWNENPLNGNFPIAIPGTGIQFLMKCKNDDTVVKTLYWDGFYGGWEPFSIRIWCKLALKSKVVADVGSYTGIYSLMASYSNRNCAVHAFEASPRNFSRVKENIEINNQSNNITVNNYAISNSSGVVTFYEHYAAEGILSSINSLVEIKKENVVKVESKAISLDEYFNDIKIDLIKIDTEGAEVLALQGMKTIFSNTRPHLLIESNSIAEFASVFNNIPSDYNCYQIIENDFKLVKVSSPSAIKGFKNRNFLYTKLQQAEILQTIRTSVI